MKSTEGQDPLAILNLVQNNKQKNVMSFRSEAETEMEKVLYDAAIEGEVSTLHQLLQKDPHILDKAILNCGDKNPLHIAAFLGRVDFVKAIVNTNSDMCLARDRDGRNPLHLAAIKGRLEVLQALIDARPLAARERTDGGGTVLHLCVKHNQLEALKTLVEAVQDHELLNAKNDQGMTILHLAVLDKQTQTIEYLLEKNIDANAENANGNTASDFLQGDMDSNIERSLQEAAASQLEAVKSGNNGHIGGEWLTKKRDALMVVASLIATMAFQAGVTPAGGVWQEDLSDNSNNNAHRAGEAVMSYKHPRLYRYYIRANTVAFVSSLSIILLLISGLPFRKKLFMWGLMIVMWLTVTSIALTYGISIVIVTPKDNRDKLSHVVKISVSVWCGVMTLLLLGNTIRLLNRWLRRKGSDIIRSRRYGNSAVIELSKDKKEEALQNC